MKKASMALVLILVTSLAVYALWFNTTPAPAMRFTTLQGKQMDFASLKGKVVLVNFWATSCAGCVEEIPQLRRMAAQYDADDFVIVAVAMSYDPPNYVQRFTQQQKLPFFVTMDTHGDIARAFGDVQLTPTTFLIDSDGNIIKRYVGTMDFKTVRQLIEQNLRA